MKGKLFLVIFSVAAAVATAAAALPDVPEIVLQAKPDKGHLQEVARGKLGGATGLVFDGDFVWTGWTRKDAGAKTFTSKIVRKKRPMW